MHECAKPMCFYQMFEVTEERTIDFWGEREMGKEHWGGMYNREEGSWHRRQQHEPRPGVEVTGVEGEWPCRGQAAWEECWEVQLEEEQEQCVKGATGPCSFSYSLVTPLIVIAALWKENVQVFPLPFALQLFPLFIISTLITCEKVDYHYSYEQGN